jgi:hypothetical protein
VRRKKSRRNGGIVQPALQREKQSKARTIFAAMRALIFLG